MRETLGHSSQDKKPASFEDVAANLAIPMVLSLGVIASGAYALGTIDMAEKVKQNDLRIVDINGELAGNYSVVDLKDVLGFDLKGKNVIDGLGFVPGKFEGKDTTMVLFAWTTSEGNRLIQLSQAPIEKIKFAQGEGKAKTLSFSMDPSKTEKLAWNRASVFSNPADIVRNSSSITISVPNPSLFPVGKTS